MKQFIQDKGNGLLLEGDCGTGKTHLAVAILNALLAKGICGVFVTAPELLQKIRDSYSKRNTDQSDIINLVKTADFLVLDDLGAEKANEWTEEQLYVVINSRYECGLPTVITTNCNLDTLEAKIGPRSFSRIIEMCDGVAIEGLDYRKRKPEVS